MKFLYIYICISISIYFILKLYVHVIRTDEDSHGYECMTMAGFKKTKQNRAFEAGLSVLPVPLGAEGTAPGTEQVSLNV